MIKILKNILKVLSGIYKIFFNDFLIASNCEFKFVYYELLCHFDDK